METEFPCSTIEKKHFHLKASFVSFCQLDYKTFIVSTNLAIMLKNQGKCTGLAKIFYSVGIQFDNSVVESAGLLKMDFLGLKTLTLIKDTVKIVKARHGVQLPSSFIIGTLKFEVESDLNSLLARGGWGALSSGNSISGLGSRVFRYSVSLSPSA